MSLCREVGSLYEVAPCYRQHTYLCISHKCSDYDSNMYSLVDVQLAADHFIIFYTSLRTAIITQTPELMSQECYTLLFQLLKLL